MRRSRAHARARFRVESLEPRWLLSTFGGTETEPPVDPVVKTDPVVVIPVAVAVYGPVSPLAPSLADDWTTAELLPDGKLIQVKGNPSQGALPDLFEIRLDGTTATVRFTLRSAWDDRPVAESLQLFDAQWNEYAHFTPSFDQFAFEYAVSVDPEAPTSLYVKVALPAGADAAGADWDSSSSVDDPFAYVLDVACEGVDESFPWQGGGYEPPESPESPGKTGPSDVVFPKPGDDEELGGSWQPPTEGGGVTAPPTPDYSTEPQPTSGSGSGGGYGAGSGVNSGASTPPYAPPRAGGSLAVNVPIVVGPLPMRSAAPLGGVFGASESTPLVDRHEGARADLAMFDPARALDDVDFNPRDYLPAEAPSDRFSAPRIIALRGPGGLPMLATALIAGTTSAASPANKPQADEQVPVEAQAETPVATEPLFRPQGGTTTEEADPNRPVMIAARGSGATRNRAPRRRASLLPGLTLAFGLGVSLILPDLAAALQFTPPARPRIRLRWLRRAAADQ